MLERYHEEQTKTAAEAARESNLWHVSRVSQASAVFWLLTGLYLTGMISGLGQIPGLIPWQIWLDWLLGAGLGTVLCRRRRPQTCNARLLGGLCGTVAVLLPVSGLWLRRLQAAALLTGFSHALTISSVLHRHTQKALCFLGVDEDAAERMVRHLPFSWYLVSCALLMFSTMTALRIGYTLGYALLALASAVSVVLNALNEPVDARVLGKLELYRRQQAEGRANPALKKWLDSRLVARYRRPWLILFVMQFLRIFYRHHVTGTQGFRVDEETPTVFLANHGNIYGPVAARLNTPVYVRPWVISYVMSDLNETAEYLYKYTFAHQKWLLPCLRMPMTRLVSRISLWGMRGLESVPVYRDHPAQLMKTFRAAVDAVNCGDAMLIFPENPNAVAADHGYERDGVGELFSGFAMMAPICYSRTGKCCHFIPMFSHQESRTVGFGHEVVYDPSNDPVEERERLVSEISGEMNRLARELDAAWQQSKKH